MIQDPSTPNMCEQAGWRNSMFEGSMMRHRFSLSRGAQACKIKGGTYVDRYMSMCTPL